MKIYVSVGPNPRIVRMFAAEKGRVLQEHWVDLIGGENRQEPFLRLNPAGELPLLQLASGVVITETVAICEYLDEISGGTSLIGATPEARAQTRMWIRRVEHKYCGPVSSAFRYGPGLGLFKDRIRCLPQAAEGMALVARDGEIWLEEQLAGQEFVTGSTMTLADIILYAFADFAARRVGLPLLEEHQHLKNWFERMDMRASARETAAMAFGLTTS